MFKRHYCKKCGWIGSVDEDDPRCKYCEAVAYIVPKEYTVDNQDGGITNLEFRERLREKLRQSSPEYDPDLAAERKAFFERHSALFEAAMKAQEHAVKCFYCGSTNVRKLDWFDRIGSTESLWFDRGMVGKQFHCNQCGADF